MRACVFVVVLAGCGTVEGPLLHARAPAVVMDGAVVMDAAIAMNDAGMFDAPIAQSMTWQYQLTGPLDLDLDAELFVIDLFEPEPEQIAALHASGKVVVAYLSAGTLESYRDDADAFPESAIGEPLENYPNERWLDYRDPTVRALMAARLTQARDKGFDGVVPTSLAAYQRTTGFDLTAETQREYSAFLASEAHARGLHICMSSDFEQVAALAVHYDWAVHFNCIARDQCDQLAPLSAQGKPVFDIETEGEAADVCGRAAELGINVLLKRPQFDAYRVGCQ
jgi:hypothetical protein